MTPNATNYVTEARTGLWTTSSDEENWPGDAFFVDWRDAVRYGLAEDHSYIARVVELTDDDVAWAFVREADEADEQLRNQDEWAWCEDPLVQDPVGDARAELLHLVKAWVQKHQIRVPRWHVMDSQALPDSDEAEEFILSGELDDVLPLNEGRLRPGDVVATDGAAVDLRPATVDDLVPGAEAWYTPVRLGRAFRGVVEGSAWEASDGTLFVNLKDMEPAYADAVDDPNWRRISANLRGVLVPQRKRKAQGGAS